MHLHKYFWIHSNLDFDPNMCSFNAARPVLVAIPTLINLFKTTLTCSALVLACKITSYTLNFLIVILPIVVEKL